MLLLRERDNSRRRMPGAAHMAGWKDTSLPPGLLHPLGSGRMEETWESAKSQIGKCWDLK